jgi:hypothetical protein
MKKYLFISVIVINISLKAQLSNPYQILNYPIEINSTIEFINDSNKYFGTNQEDAYLQALGTLYSFVGHYDKAKDVFVRRNKKRGYIPDDLLNFDLSPYQIDQDSLNKLYANFNVILFNETHHISQHRGFLYSQLEILRDLGFSYLALEALNAKDTSVEQRKYPINKYPELTTGVYINDPVYGNLIRKAIELGFTLISYDSYSSNREEEQANNILKVYDESHGKMVVLGGYAHISEKNGMMGSFLKNKLNTDLLSISQFTRFSIDPIFPSANSSENLFLEKDSTNKYDYYLYYNTVRSKSNIPEWYKLMFCNNISLTSVYDKYLKTPYLIQIYNINEVSGVPVYQYLSFSNNDVRIAVPNKGKYILKITNSDNFESLTFKL